MSLGYVNKNAILTQVLNVLVEQTEKGVKKYGESVNPDSLETIEWLDHAVQEHADAIVYLTCLKQKLVEGKR